MQFLKPLEQKVRQLRNRMTPLIYRGNAVQCPVCERTFSRFLPAGSGHRSREGAVCPFCRSRERDRLNFIFLQSRPELFKRNPIDFLHVAPEPKLAEYFRARVGEGYISADLIRKDVMVNLDVSSMDFADNRFDAIYCSHVFQDVPDDQAAFSECYRTLKPGGWAVLNVPIDGEQTQIHERPAKLRGHWDKRPDEHLRSYGADYAEKLAAVGFEVEAMNAQDLVIDVALRERMGVATRQAGFIHFVRKPQSAG